MVMLADQALSKPMTMDDDLLLKSLLCVAESLEDLLGPHGARVMLRAAGRRAAANLIDGLPLRLPPDEAVGRSASLLVELGFAERIAMADTSELRVSGLPINRASQELGIAEDGAGRYFFVGLLEGFSRRMSGAQVQVDKCSQDDADDIWSIQL